MGKALLIIVGGFSIIFTGVIFNMTSSQSRSARAIVTQHEKWIARNAAESAANVAIAKIYQDIDWSAGLSGTFEGASYSVTAAKVTTAADSITQAKRIRVLAVTTFEGQSDSSIVELMQPAYSYYTLFTEQWPQYPTYIRYEPGDTLWGPIHSDDPTNGIRINNGSPAPVFIGKVSSVNTAFSGATPNCYGGTEMGASPIGIPSTFLDPIMAVTGANVVEYTNHDTITFDAGGTFDDGSGPILISLNQIIRTANGSNKDLYVQGVVSGQVTVVCDNDLFIENDITYNDPTTDFLGLIARDDVIINEPWPGAPIIQAAILAGDEIQFPQVPGSGSLTVALTFMGSRAYSGVDDPQPLLGGSKYQITAIADPRLRDRTPPYFPRVFRSDGLPLVEQVYRSK